MALIDGLLAYYSMEEDVSDSHSSHDGTDNGTTDTAGIVLRGRNFDGTNDYISLPTGIINAATMKAGYSISIWLNPDNIPAQYEYIMALNEEVTHRFAFNSDGGIDFAMHDGSSWQYAVDASPSEDVWTHYVMTFDGTTGRLYKNGNATPVATLTCATPRDEIWINTFNLNTNDYHGVMDEVGIWNRALTTDEISSLYNGGDGLAYPLAEGTNTQVNIGDAWKSISAVKINIGDSWKAVAGIKINIGDSWKTVF